jgi:quercetin dioxygenase-like cupin family protein
MNYRSITSAAALLAVVVLFITPASAQDAAVVDSAHYKVEFENDQVRVLRIKYGPNEKSVMHEHPAGLVVFLTDGKTLMTYPDGTSEEMTWPAGLTAPAEATKHQPTNLSDEGFELIQVEFKNIDSSK